MSFVWERARSVFLSDLHLGWRLSKPDIALELLRRCRPRYVYLVGDTFEGLHRRLDLRSAIAASFFDILRSLSAQGTHVAILTGNHDHALAEMSIDIPFYAGTHAIHTSLRGERYLVTHGDIFESMDRNAQTPVGESDLSVVGLCGGLGQPNQDPTRGSHGTLVHLLEAEGSTGACAHRRIRTFDGTPVSSLWLRWSHLRSYSST